MKADSPHWKVMGPPASPEEAAALEAFREVLPDDGRTTAWVNLTFIDQNHRTAEIDVLLLTPVGFFCVELKGWHGSITGTSQRWYQAGKVHPNPFLVTDAKAKRLASLLKSYATPSQASKVPWVRALVVLHGEGSSFDVDESGRAGVLKLDGYTVSSKPPLRRLSEFLATPPSHPKDEIDPQRGKLVELLCHKADFRPTPKTRMVGDYVVAEPEPVAQGADWQDVVVTHPNLPKLRQRLRLFDLAPKASASERARVEQLAQRQFQLTHGVAHEGVAVPKQYLSTDDGPALVFDYRDSERPLDVFLEDEESVLSLDARVALVEQLGETLRYAHQRHLLHRALSPSRVWARRTSAGDVRLEVRDWQSGQRDRSTASSTRWTVLSRGESDLVGLSASEDLVWLAPEARQSVADVPGAPLDVFGLGALAFLVLTGRAPATTIAGVQEVQLRDGCFDPRTVTAALPDGLADAIRKLTAVDEAERPASIEEALDEIRKAWNAARRPEPTAPRIEVVDPLDAQVDDLLADRFIVSGKRGEGSSGIALAVKTEETGDDKELILKVAKDDAAGRRLEIEAEVLEGLDHPRIVQLHESLEVGGRRALLMSDAGRETLATKLVTDGQVTLEQLQRWGTQLLEAMAYLVDDRGVFHRDIKPANLGIAPDPGSRKPSLVLFDFSLAREPLDNIVSGTPGYLDPYLGSGRRRRYDRAAELWAVSVTLFEMATGVLPWWSGLGAPASAADAAVIEPTSFDPAVGELLATFFRRALAPDAADRFGNVDDLLAAWGEAFASLTLDEVARGKDDARAAAATLATPLEEAGLSAQAMLALRRLTGIVTVGDLLGVHPVRINGIRGLGETFRKEVQARVAQWRAGLGGAAPAVTSADAAGVDRLVTRLLGTLAPADEPLVRAVLGLGDVGPWPTFLEVAQHFQTTREAVAALADSAVSAWSSDEALSEALGQLVEVLASSGRVMTVPEAAAELVTRRGSTLDGVERVAFSRALVRALVELDARYPEPSLVLRRRHSAAKADLLALSERVARTDEGEHVEADLLTELAGVLGETADSLVSGGVVAMSTAVAALRVQVGEVDRAGLWRVSDARLLRLAAAASETAEVSGFQELYPRTLAPADALEHALRGKPGRTMSQVAVRRTVEARFPRLDSPLPVSDATLDALVTDLFPDLVNREGIYEPRSTVLASTGTMSSTHLAPTAAADVARSLEQSLARRSALTLTVAPRRYMAAVRALADGYDVDVLDVATLVVTSVKAAIVTAGGQWGGLLGWDALERSSAEWLKLQGAVQRVVLPDLRARLASERPLLIHVGPLLRYGMDAVLADLLDTGTARPAARWILVAKPGDARTPQLEGRTVPLGPSGWIELPRDLALIAADDSLGASAPTPASRTKAPRTMTPRTTTTGAHS